VQKLLHALLVLHGQLQFLRGPPAPR
jgi:hypothetical protein